MQRLDRSNINHVAVTATLYECESYLLCHVCFSLFIHLLRHVDILHHYSFNIYFADVWNVASSYHGSAAWQAIKYWFNRLTGILKETDICGHYTGRHMHTHTNERSKVSVTARREKQLSWQYFPESCPIQETLLLQKLNIVVLVSSGS